MYPSGSHLHHLEAPAAAPHRPDLDAAVFPRGDEGPGGLGTAATQVAVGFQESWRGTQPQLMHCPKTHRHPRNPFWATHLPPHPTRSNTPTCKRAWAVFKPWRWQQGAISKNLHSPTPASSSPMRCGHRDPHLHPRGGGSPAAPPATGPPVQPCRPHPRPRQHPPI